MGFPRQEYWSRLPFLPPGDLPDPGIKPVSPVSLSLAGEFFTTEPPGKLRMLAAAVKSLQSCPTVWPHRLQPTRLPRPWDSPGQNTGVGCHFLLQCMKIKKWKWSRLVVSNSSRPHGRQPTRLLHPWDFPGKSVGVGCLIFKYFRWLWLLRKGSERKWNNT